MKYQTSERYICYSEKKVQAKTVANSIAIIICPRASMNKYDRILNLDFKEIHQDGVNGNMHSHPINQ